MKLNSLLLKCIAAGLVDDYTIGASILVSSLDFDELLFVHSWMLKYTQGQVTQLYRRSICLKENL